MAGQPAPPHTSRPWSKRPTHSPHTPPTLPQSKHTSNTPPVHTWLVKPKPNPLIHSPPTPPRAKHIHISHTPPTPLIPHTTLIHSTSAALDISTQHNHTSSISRTSISVTLAPSHSFSIDTCNTNNSTRIAVTATTAST